MRNSPLCPNLICDHFTSIPFEALAKEGRRHFIFDADGTLRRDKYSDINSEVLSSLRTAQAMGWVEKVCVVSNVSFVDEQTLDGLEDLTDTIRGEGYVPACNDPRLWHRCKPKPHRQPFTRGLALLGTKPEETVMVGDQLLTDILGGNLACCYTILVDPLETDSVGLGTRLRRGLIERPLLALCR